MYDRNRRLYGILDNYIDEIHDALEDCDRNYPSSKQLLQEVEETELNSQSMGQALTELERLSVLDIYNGDADPNRYDLTEYQSDVMEDVRRYFSDNED